MPVSKVQRRMRRHWSVVLERADGYACQISPDGVSRGRFVADVLYDVDPRDCDEVVSLLARRKVLWLSTYRGEVTVYGSRPEAKPQRRLAGKKPIDGLIADLAPLLLDALDNAEARKPRGTPPEVEEAVRVSVGRIVAVCRKRAAEGLSLDEMRKAMWRLLSPRLMSEIAYQEPRLHYASEADAFVVEPPRPKRLPRGLTAKEKAFAIIQQGGFEGVTKTTLMRRIQPLMSANDLAEIIGELETEGAIVWGEMRAHIIGRPGVRLFTAEAGLPRIGSDGTMIRRLPLDNAEMQQ